MRAGPFALLLLLLPGLLLPVGLWLHVCRCEPQSQPQRSCCAQHAEPAASRSPHSCCRRAPAPELPADGLPCAQDQCGCVWLPLPETGQDPVLPATAGQLPAIAAPVTDFAWAPAPPASRQHRGGLAGSRAPPPPRRQRNLPLRL